MKKRSKAFAYLRYANLFWVMAVSSIAVSLTQVGRTWEYSTFMMDCLYRFVSALAILILFELLLFAVDFKGFKKTGLSHKLVYCAMILLAMLLYCAFAFFDGIFQKLIGCFDPVISPIIRSVWIWGTACAGIASIWLTIRRARTVF